MGPERIEGFKHQPEGLLRLLRYVDFQDGHGAARHHHVRTEGPALGGKKLPALAESVEHIPHDGGVELLPQQLKQLGVIFPFHAFSSVTARSNLNRADETCRAEYCIGPILLLSCLLPSWFWWRAQFAHDKPVSHQSGYQDNRTQHKTR